MRYIVLFIVAIFVTSSAFAQYPKKEGMSREDKQEKNEARQSRIDKKNDYALFRKQAMALKELADEKKKIPVLQKNNKGVVKVVIAIDSNDNDDDAKTLIGYIQQIVGDNSTNMYELTYEKAQKKIVSVKRTPEAADADNEMREEKEERAADKKTTAPKKAAPKKNKDKDDEDNPDEDEKPTKKKTKEKDKDD